MIKVEGDHANEGQPQQNSIEDFPAGAGPYLARIEGYFEKVQDNRQVRDLMREEPDYAQVISPDIAGDWARLPTRTYGFMAAKFDESIKKRANTCEAESHSDIIGIGCGENFGVTFEGLDDRKHHFLKIGIQQVRLLLVTFYLRIKGRTCHQNRTYLEACTIAHCQLQVMQA